jgi:type II secretory pathway pseudopilin PulG
LARHSGKAAFTLAEVVVSLAIASTVIVGIVTGYINCVYRADWLACSVAAQSLATQRMEQVRAARWDTLANPPLDEVTTNQFPVTVQPLDLPRLKDKVINATNRTLITVIATDPPVRLIQVECTWRYPGRGISTNRVSTYRTPAQ